jgi:hypothetical protein
VSAWASSSVTPSFGHVWPGPPLFRRKRDQAGLLDTAASAHTELPADLERRAH